MAAGENIWPLITDLAVSLDGDREASERTLDQLQGELRSIPRNARDELRRRMVQIVAALSRLEVRMIESDGPLPTAI
jgi:hypothetical protein